LRAAEQDEATIVQARQEWRAESLKMNRFLTASLVWRRRRGLDWAMGGLGWEGFGGEPAG
jgi:hypothetical protein